MAAYCAAGPAIVASGVSRSVTPPVPIPLRRPTARVQRTLPDYPTRLKMCLTLATAIPRELAGDTTVGGAVELA
ncbi:MAG: hypothetical protein M3319_11410 [Actinomycetota bacterium]|nr:hypothetical protein [Actinomycetota bacterium]